MNWKEYHNRLYNVMDDFVHKIYDITEHFPRKELFGLTSQLRRASLSIILNYIEGYGRQKRLVTKNFLDISYGSLREANYLLQFSYKRRYLSTAEYDRVKLIGVEVGKMLWTDLLRYADGKGNKAIKH